MSQRRQPSTLAGSPAGFLALCTLSCLPLRVFCGLLRRQNLSQLRGQVCAGRNSTFLDAQESSDNPKGNSASPGFALVVLRWLPRCKSLPRSTLDSRVVSAGIQPKRCNIAPYQLPESGLSQHLRVATCASGVA